MNAPQAIIDAAASMLAPHGIDLVKAIKEQNSYVRYMSTKQASEYSGLSSKTIRDKVIAGEIVGKKVTNTPKGMVLVQKKSLDKWLDGLSNCK